MWWICFCSQQNTLNFHKSNFSSPEYDLKHWNKQSICHFETFTLQPSYLTHCWVLQPMAEPEPCMPHRVNHVWSGCMVLHHEHELCTQRMHLVFGKLRLLCFCIPVVSCRVWIESAHMFFGSLSLTSGARWPAWSRATAASLSSAPPPPPPANHSPARWSPGRNWKPRTSVPTIFPPPMPLPLTLKPTLLLPFLIIFGLCSYCTASLYGTEACLHKQKTKNFKNLRQKLNRLYI